jgi:HPt (histidine-containing phosphotransfer) domain-containing protein
VAGAAMTASLPELQQALLWRGAMAARLQDAGAALADALAGAPTSVERVQTARALKATNEALKSCRDNMAVARQRIEAAG